MYTVAVPITSFKYRLLSAAILMPASSIVARAATACATTTSLQPAAAPSTSAHSTGRRPVPRPRPGDGVASTST